MNVFFCIISFVTSFLSQNQIGDIFTKTLALNFLENLFPDLVSYFLAKWSQFGVLLPRKCLVESLHLELAITAVMALVGIQYASS